LPASYALMLNTTKSLIQQYSRVAVLAWLTLLAPAIAAEPSKNILELPAEVQLNTLTHIPLSESEVRTKVEYAHRLFDMSLAKRISSSHHEQAIMLLEQAHAQADAAQQALANGALSEADDLVNQCYRSIAIASTLVPSEHQRALAKTTHSSMVEGLAHAKELHAKAYQRVAEISQHVKFDAEAVYQLEQLAMSEVVDNNYQEANRHLRQARMLVDLATMKMLDNQTVTYHVDVSTPALEYQYEVGRFRSYEELIPVAIEMKKPNKMQLMLITRKVDEGLWKAEQAQITADAGDYPKAIRMVMDASVDIRRGLKLMKVKLYE